jgi:hypothetical protein
MANKWGLEELTKQLVDMIEARYKDQNKNYGVVLLPEGLIEFIPEFEKLIAELNELGDTLGDHAQPEDVAPKLSRENKHLFEYLPLFMKKQLLMDRDPHGNVQVAKIETEKLLAATVRPSFRSVLAQRKRQISSSSLSSMPLVTRDVLVYQLCLILPIVLHLERQPPNSSSPTKLVLLRVLLDWIKSPLHSGDAAVFQ